MSDSLTAPPIPLDTRTAPIDFPVDTLPAVLQDIVRELAEETQTPPDLAGLLSIAMVATAAGGRVELQVKPNWTEPTCLWVAVSLPPGARKTPVLKRLQKPLSDYETRVNPAIKRRASEARARRSLLERRKKIAEQAVIQEGASDAELLQLATQLDEFDVPQPLKLFVNDCTPEKMAHLLAEQKGRLAWISDEGGIFETIAGRYSKRVPNIDVFNKAHDRSPVRVARQSQEDVQIDSPALTMALAIQPSVLNDMQNTPAFKGRGLLDRFFYAVPRVVRKPREVNPPTMNAETEARYNRVIQTILDKGETLQAPWRMELDKAAMERLDELREELERELIGNLEPVAEWANKLAGRLARIAGLFALVRVADATQNLATVVTKEDLEMAWGLKPYLCDHALHAFEAMSADLVVSKAKALLRKVTSIPSPEFSARDLFQKVRGQQAFKKMDDLWPALKVLEEHGYIQRRDRKEGTRGRPSTVYVKHPDERY